MPLTVGGGVRTLGRHPRAASGGRGQGLRQHRSRPPSGIHPRGGREVRQPMRRGRDRRQEGRVRPFRGLYPWRPEGDRARRHGPCRKLVAYGAGEILLTSMDRDGTREGYDLPLTRAIADAVTVPVIASGGRRRSGRSGGGRSGRPRQRGPRRLDLPFRRGDHRRRQSPACCGRNSGKVPRLIADLLDSVDDRGGTARNFGQKPAAARLPLRPTAMGQQYEFKLMDDPEVLLRSRRTMLCRL